MDIYKFEQILLHLMNNDRLYRANRSPADINVKMMEVLERRITVHFAFFSYNLKLEVLLFSRKFIYFWVSILKH